jgi:DNA-binding transcriptional LysR family regulator
MDLPAISAFVAVGETGGFRAAATVLGMTSSGVSKAVSRLEARLGIQLVARTTRAVRLTPAGKAFHGRCKSILAQLGEAEHSAAAASVIPQGKLTVTMPSTGFARSRAIPIIAQFVQLHPQVEVEARLSDRVSDLVEEGIDVAIRIGPLPDSQLIAVKLWNVALMVCGSPEYLAENGVPTHPDELENHRFVGFVTSGTSARYEYRFTIDGRVRTMQFQSQLTVDSGEALVVAASHSAGLVMVTDYLAEDMLRSGRLVRILTEFEAPPMAVSIVHAPSRHPSPAARVLIDMLRRDAGTLA